MNPRFSSIRWRSVIILVVALAFVLTASYAEAASTSPPTVYILKVTLPNRGALDAISQAGLSVDNVQGLTATVYTTLDGLQWLRSHGYAFEESGEEVPQLKADRYSSSKALGVYHSYDTMTSFLQTYAAAYPTICRLISVGQSVQGRELWAMEITSNPDTESDKPEFKYISTMHGDEPVGTETCLYFIDHLLTGYGTDPRVTQMVDSTVIWILPMMNPDGHELGIRYNADYVDLNRDFPEYPTDFTGTIYDGTPLGADGREPEVANVMKWTAQHHFVLAANFHTGSLVVNYPYDDDPDNNPDNLLSINLPTPDDALFKNLALVYATPNVPMYDNNFYPFSHGTVNGGLWYVISGGMQDWNYRYLGDDEVTIELSNVKTPLQSSLPTLWADNEESMMRYVEAVQIGLRGIVTDSVTGVPLWAKITIVGNTQPVFTDPAVGDYHRLLLPGTYTVEFSSHGYQTQSISQVQVNSGPATRLDMALTRLGSNPADVNGDGQVNAVDVQLVINAALGLPVLYNCDVNGGGVNATDVQLTINAALGL